MNKMNLHILFFAILLFGCSHAEIKPDIPLPAQDIDTPLTEGKSRVIFFNNTSYILYPFSSGTINIKIDDKNLGRLEIGEYIQVFLEKQDYDLLLEHVDILTFQTEHKFSLKDDIVYVKVFAKPISTQYGVVERLPNNFFKKYKPAYAPLTDAR